MPAPVVTRPITITYGSLSVGGTTNYILHGPVRFQQSYAKFDLSFEVLVQNATASTFVTQCLALEVAFRVPNKDLTVVNGTDTWITLAHSTNTGMNTRATWEKAGSGADSSNSRLYKVAISGMLPADETGKSARVANLTSVELQYDGPGILSMAVTAAYTAISSTAALAGAQAAFPTFVAAHQTTLGGTWDDASGITYERDDENKMCRCRHSSRQLIHAQSNSTTNDATLINVNVTISTKKVHSPSYPGLGTKSLVTILASFSCGVRTAQSTDLKTVWESIARPRLTTVTEQLSGCTGLAVLTENPVLDYMNNRLHGTMVFLAANGASLLSAHVNVSNMIETSSFWVAVANGNPYARDEHSRPGVKVREIRMEVLELGSGSPSAFNFHRDLVDDAAGEGYKWVRDSYPIDTRTEYQIPGLSGRVLVRRRVKSTDLVYVEVLNKAGGSGSSAPSGVMVTRTRR